MADEEWYSRGLHPQTPVNLASRATEQKVALDARCKKAPVTTSDGSIYKSCILASDE